MMAIWRHDNRGWHVLSPAGFPDEATLHTLVEQAPQLLPLAGSPRLTIVGREVQLGNGSADLLAVEPSGRLVIIEIKLAKNAESRRAVVAQVLAYAAYLHGTTPEQLEQGILAKHLQQRHYTSLADAVVSEDQEGAFDANVFADGLMQSVSQGYFRLVIVLDSAPSELVRLADFLEYASDKLSIDLIAVSNYVVEGSTLLVPQRIAGELGKATETPSSVSTAKPLQGNSVDGADDFVGSIVLAPTQYQPTLKKLAAWASLLEKQGLARLSTSHGKGRLTLLPKLLVDDVGLVTIWNDNGPYLSFWRTVFERRAPLSIQPVEQLLDKKIGQGNWTNNITDELLATLTVAYQQAASGNSLGAR